MLSFLVHMITRAAYEEATWLVMFNFMFEFGLPRV